MEETKPGWVTVYTLSLRGCHQTPPPAINLQEEAEAVTDANLFITDSDALWTALIKAYPGTLPLGGMHVLQTQAGVRVRVHWRACVIGVHLLARRVMGIAIKRVAVRHIYGFVGGGD